MGNSEAAGNSNPPVPVMKGVSLNEITIEPGGSHTGPAVKRIDTDSDVVTVLCPCGHYVAQMPVRLRNSYYKRPITCEGSLPGYPR